MKISEIMTRSVDVARPSDTVQQVARRMSELDTGFMPICDGRKVQGVITDRDIVIRVVAEGGDVNAPVSQYFTSDVEYALETDNVDKVVDRMGDQQIRRMVVVDANKDLVGVVSIGDIAREHKAKPVGQALGEISESGDQPSQS